MSDFINTVDALGDEAVTNSIIDRSITEYKDNNVTSIGACAFYPCSNLISIDLPNVTSIGYMAFRNCDNLVSATFPRVATVGEWAFAPCAKLETIDFPNATSIGNDSLRYCPVLKTLILRSETMCSLYAIFSLYDTPIKSGTGYIYVPRALVDTYKTATNWTTYADQFRALEDYTVDGTITGALDETKI